MKENGKETYSRWSLNILFFLCLWGISFDCYAQQGHPQKYVKGVVMDEDGEPLPGASILLTKVKNKQWGCATNSEGIFELKLPLSHSGDINIEVSFIGMQTKTVLVKDINKLCKVVLKPKDNSLNDIVVTGYQNLDPKRVTSAITSVNTKDILMPGMTTIDQALEGNIPDLLFMQNSGEAGATARLRVRGTSTLVGNREPLWVLNGIILQDPVNVSTEELNDPDYINYIGNAISGINPQDIERIDVLKDASATALYGTRAANGVIVITTKKGEIGKARISYSNQTKLSIRPRYSDRNISLMTSQERVRFGKDLVDAHYAFPKSMSMVGYEGAYHRWQTGVTTYDEFLEEVQQYETVNTDWFKILTQDALSHSHSVSISGGADNTRYYASFSYGREEGTVRTVHSDRYTAYLNLNSNITENLTASFGLNGSVQKKNHLPTDINPLDYAYNTTRTLPCYNSDGTLFYYKRHAYNIGTAKSESQYNYNMLNEMENSSNEYNGNSIMVNGNLSYSLFERSLRIELTGSYSRSATDQRVWYGENTNYVAQLRNAEAGDMPLEGKYGYCDLPYGGVLNTSNNISESFTGRAQVNYNKGFGKNDNHIISAMLGYEVNSAINNGISDETRGYLKDRGMKYITMTTEELDKYPYYKEWLAAGHRTLTSNKNNQLSGYLSLSYSYGNLFTLNANGRFDASNKFGSRSNEKFLPVWSVSGMWNPVETFPKLKEQKWISDIRLRTSYGKTGNMLDNQSPNMLIKKGTLDSYYGENISTVSVFPNPNLRWEQTDQVNVGLELQLFGSQLSFSTDYYYKYTKDAFAPVNVSTINGLNSYQMNNGDIENRGISFTLRGYPIKNQDWSWYLSTMYSYNKNTTKTKTSDIYSISNYLNGTAIINGESIGTFYSYKFLGLNHETGIPMFDDYEDRQHLLENKSLEDIVKLVMENSGNREPTLNGSVSSTLTYKQWSLRTNFTYNIGSKIRLFELYAPIISGISAENNVRKEFNNRWLVPGDEKSTVIPTLISPSDPSYTKYMFHYSAANAQDKIETFASSIWNMYDKSNIRVVSGNYVKLQTLNLGYTFKAKQLAKTPFKTCSFTFTTTNVFTICSKKLKGQDPTQAGFAKPNLAVRPTYTLGVNVSF